MTLLIGVYAHLPFVVVPGMGLNVFFFFLQAEDGIRDFHVTGVQTCALPISRTGSRTPAQPQLPRPGSSRPGTGRAAHPPRRIARAVSASMSPPVRPVDRAGA